MWGTGPPRVVLMGEVCGLPLRVACAILKCLVWSLHETYVVLTWPDVGHVWIYQVATGCFSTCRPILTFNLYHIPYHIRPNFQRHTKLKLTKCCLGVQGYRGTANNKGSMKTENCVPRKFGRIYGSA